MNIAFLIGRIIFGGYWFMASFNHFKNRNYMSEYAKAKGTPSPKLAEEPESSCSWVVSACCWASTLWSGSFC